MPIVHHNTRSGVDKLADKLTLSDEQFEKIAHETEQKAKYDYEGYKKQLIAFASLGYFYIGLIVALLFGLIGGIILIILSTGRIYGAELKIILILLVVVFLVLKSLWVKFDPPKGIPLEKKDYPELFKLLDEVCTKLNTRADKVVLDENFNAAVMEVPKLGLLGFNTNYLMLGLPFLQSVTREELKAVLAHEFGHLSGKHSQTSSWIYSLRMQWANILKEMGQQSVLFYPFFAWYMPRYIAYSMIMIRDHEKEADADAVKITSADDVANMLVLVELKGKHLGEEIWQEIYKKARTQEEAPSGIYNEVGERINALPSRKLRQWLDECLKYEGSKIETHPPLRERLALCDRLTKFEHISDEQLEKLVAPIPKGQSAAETLLGDNLQALSDKISEDWHTSVKEIWQQRHQQFLQIEEEIKKLDAKQEKEALTINDLKHKAYLLEELDEHKEAVPIYYQILEQSPSDAIAHFNLGAYISRKHKQENLNGEDALKHLEACFKTDIRLAYSAKYLAMGYLKEQKRDHEIARFDQYETELKEALDERALLKDTDELLPADLDKETREAVEEMCLGVPQIKEMVVVQKRVHKLPGSRHFVVGAKVYAKNADEGFSEAMANIIMQYFNQFPGTKSVVVFDMWTKKLEAKMKEVPDAVVFKV